MIKLNLEFLPQDIVANIHHFMNTCHLSYKKDYINLENGDCEYFRGIKNIPWVTSHIFDTWEEGRIVKKVDRYIYDAQKKDLPNFLLYGTFDTKPYKHNQYFLTYSTTKTTELTAYNCDRQCLYEVKTLERTFSTVKVFPYYIDKIENGDTFFKLKEYDNIS